MKVPGMLETMREGRPVLVAAAEATAASFGAIALVAFMPAASRPVWTLIVWAALAASRSPAYQVAAAATLGLWADVASATPLGQSWLPLAGALLVAPRVLIGDVPRWGWEHFVFAAVALVAGLSTQLVASIAIAGYAGAGFGIGQWFASIFALLLVAAPIFASRFVRDIAPPSGHGAARRNLAWAKYRQ